MKRQIAAGLSILAVVLGVGWKLAQRPEASAGLQDIRLDQRSEHSRPGPASALAGIRIRLSGSSDFGYERGATGQQVPEVSLAAD